MYDIKQFRPTLYALLIMGFVGYGVASQAMGISLIALCATILNIWLYKTDQLKPLPRLAANLITLAFAGWLMMRIRQLNGPPIFAIGEFLVLLQLVKLYELRANRDYAQLLVLSLLLMVAAAISTGSLLFGVIFVIYLFISLYGCLLFHLKTETDYAKAVIGIDESKLNPATLKQDQKFLPRSMRRLTMLVSSSAISMAVVVFVFFPRGSGAGIIGNISFKPSQAMTGFSDQVSFQDVARISQNDSEVAQVKITRNGTTFGANGEPIYLRGSTPDAYVSDPNDSDRWKWIRNSSNRYQDINPNVQRGTEITLNDSPVDGDRYIQDIRLKPTGTNILFAMPGAFRVTFGREISIKVFSKSDEVLQAQDAIRGDLPYQVISTGKIGPIPEPDSVTSNGWPINPGKYSGESTNSSTDENPNKFVISEDIRKFALKEEVSGIEGAGKRRLTTRTVTQLDEEVARNIEHYLQNHFTYTLDLTDANIVRDKDPLVQFLYEFKKGHCEYFAGAMTLMCQSLGMHARMVVGFKCDEYNSMGDYYQVRQSHAHAWVEVLTLNGWQQFDPTAFTESPNAGGGASIWKRFMNFIDYLDYSWGNNIVNYDTESRTGLIQSLTTTLDTVSNSISSSLSTLQQNWFNISNFDEFSGSLMSAILYIGVAVVFLALLYFLIERIRLKKRARRIGLSQLPTSSQVRLARQLAFYDELMRRLERRDIIRPAHLTQMEFSQSIGFLPGEIYTAIRRLTRVFYRVRFGSYELDGRQQSRLMRIVEKIDSDLERQANR